MKICHKTPGAGEKRDGFYSKRQGPKNLKRIKMMAEDPAVYLRNGWDCQCLLLDERYLATP